MGDNRWSGGQGKESLQRETLLCHQASSNGWSLSTGSEREVVCSLLRFLGRAPMGMSFWKTSLGCVTSLKLAEVVARSQQPTQPPLWMEAILSACCRTSQPVHRARGTEGEGSSTPALWYQLTLQPVCTLFVSRKSRNASVVYKTVSSPSRIWLHIKGGWGQAGKKDKTPSAE